VVSPIGNTNNTHPSFFATFLTPELLSTQTWIVPFAIFLTMMRHEQDHSMLPPGYMLGPYQIEASLGQSFRLLYDYADFLDHGVVADSLVVPDSVFEPYNVDPPWKTA